MFEIKLSNFWAVDYVVDTSKVLVKFGSHCCFKNINKVWVRLGQLQLDLNFLQFSFSLRLYLKIVHVLLNSLENLIVQKGTKKIPPGQFCPFRWIPPIKLPLDNLPNPNLTLEGVNSPGGIFQTPYKSF